MQVKSLEVGTNVVAAYVSGGRAHEVPAVMDALALKASDGLEIAFNQACADVAVGKLDAAEQQLLLAQRLGEYFEPLMQALRDVSTNDNCVQSLQQSGGTKYGSTLHGQASTRTVPDPYLSAVLWVISRRRLSMTSDLAMLW